MVDATALSEEICTHDLLETMELVSRSLGVKCDVYHRTEAREYVSHAIREKAVTRPTPHE